MVKIFITEGRVACEGNYADKAIIELCREIVEMADSEVENKDPLEDLVEYVSDIIFHADGTATIKYNGGSLGRVVTVYSKKAVNEDD